MPRMARFVVPGLPHHIVQRGNHQQQVFHEADDYRLFFRLIGIYSEKYGVRVQAYCVMGNHYHLVAVPMAKTSFAKALAEVHQIYSREMHRRMETKGQLWQGRFFSCPLDDPHLYSALKYSELNPVRAHIVDSPLDYAWSSARAHVLGTPDPILTDRPDRLKLPDWTDYLGIPMDKDELDTLRKHFRTGQPLGSDRFRESVEKLSGRRLRKRRPRGKAGPKAGG